MTNPTLPPLPEPCYSALIQGPHGSEFRRLADQYDPHAARYSAEQMNERYLAGYSAALAQQAEQKPAAWITQGGKGELWWHQSVDEDGNLNADDVPLYAAPQPSTEPWPQGNPWAQAIDEALVVNCLDGTTPNSDPTTELARLVQHEVDMALDPAVSERAQDLIDRGRSEAMEGGV